MSVVDWYWQYGRNRTGEYRLDTDTWLDAVSRLEKRREKILDSKGNKSCIALWGMSQTGKSTLLSRYLDGRRVDGSNSALTWGAENVRFLAVNSAQQQNADVVFNPYNAGMDASGVAARYTIRSRNDNSVDIAYPVEMKLMTHAQFLHAIARGYVSECQQEREVLTTGVVRSFLGDNRNNQAIDRNAYEMMRDALDVVELMRNGTTRFAPLFQDNGWSALRRECLNSGLVLQSEENCRAFIQKLFWDDVQSMSNLYNRVFSFLIGANGLRPWQGKRILMTMGVAAKLLNINTGGDLGNNANAVVASYSTDDDRVCLAVGNGPGNGIVARDFGYLQALCRELVVPVRRDRVQTNALGGFFDTLDILDLPGLSRVAIGGQAAALKNAAEMTEPDLLRSVVKEGRTQSYVYNYADAYSVDAFMVLAKSTEPISKPQILDQGLLTWMQSFDKNWNYHNAPLMPFFINLTFFGTYVRNVLAANNDNLWVNVIDWVTQHFAMSDTQTAEYFITNYPHLPDGAITALTESDINRAKNQLQVLMQPLSLCQDDITAVFNDGGVDRMLGNVAAAIDINRRSNMCQSILRDCTNELVKFINDCLPQDENIVLRQMQDAINARIARLKNNSLGKTRPELSKELKFFFKANPEWFDVIPLNFQNQDIVLRMAFYKRQLENWCTGMLSEIFAIKDPTERQEGISIVQAIKASVDVNQLDSAFSGPTSIFSALGSSADGDAARLTFSLIFSNILRAGSTHRGEINSVSLVDMINRNNYPCNVLQIDPLLRRLEEIRDALQVGVRPPQVGDNELNQIKHELAV